MARTIVVVGAGKGLGNAVAERFAREGFSVVLMARGGGHLRTYVAEFAAKGIEVRTQVADAADFAGFARAFSRVVETSGTPDVVFYNVGVTVADAKVTMDAHTMVERYRTDVAGAYHCVELADTPEFEAKGGAILITGGGLALEPSADYLPLSMDKAALRTMVRAFPEAREAGCLHRIGAGGGHHRLRAALRTGVDCRAVLETLRRTRSLGGRVLASTYPARRRAWSRVLPLIQAEGETYTSYLR